MDFSLTFPSDCTMALGSTQPLVKMTTRNIPGGKGGRCARLKPHRLHVPNVVKSGTLWPTPGLLWDSFTFTVFEMAGPPPLGPRARCCDQVFRIASHIVLKYGSWVLILFHFFFETQANVLSAVSARDSKYT
jgi:hypothetical protein